MPADGNLPNGDAAGGHLAGADDKTDCELAKAKNAGGRLAKSNYRSNAGLPDRNDAEGDLANGKDLFGQMPMK